MAEVQQKHSFDQPKTVSVGQVWKERTSGQLLCVLSIHHKLELVYLVGFDGKCGVQTVKNLKVYCELEPDWSRASLMV